MDFPTLNPVVTKRAGLGVRLIPLQTGLSCVSSDLPLSRSLQNKHISHVECVQFNVC